MPGGYSVPVHSPTYPPEPEAPPIEWYDDWAPPDDNDNIYLELPLHYAAFHQASSEQDNSGSTGWPQIQPLDRTTERVNFAVKALPVPVMEYVTAVANSTQTPLEMAGAASIVAMAASCQHRYSGIRVKADYFEPLCIQIAIEAKSGEKKSSVARNMTSPFHKYECRWNEENAHKIETNRSEKRIIKSRISAIEKALSSVKKPPNDIELMAQLDVLNGQLANFVEIHPKQILADDITPEKMVDILEAQNGCLTLFSADGGFLVHAAEGRYDNKNGGLNAFLQATAGDTVRVDRIGRGTNQLDDPRLSCLFFAQPAVIADVFTNRILRERGFCARLNVVSCQSNIGNRNVNAPAVSLHLAKAYEDLIFRMLADSDSGELSMSHVAHKRYLEYAEVVEKSLLSYTDSALLAWLNKSAGAMLRIAAIIHAAEHIGTASNKQITEGTIARAIQILESLKPSNINVYGICDPAIKNAKYLLDKVLSVSSVPITRRELDRITSGKEDFNLDASLVMLEKHGYIKVDKEQATTGGRPSTIITVNPNAKN